MSAHFQQRWITNHAIRPTALFNGISQRVCILLGARVSEQQRNWSTSYLRTRDIERLFKAISYVDTFQISPVDGIVPKIGLTIEKSIFSKLTKHSSSELVLAIGGTSSIHFKDYGETYWIYPVSFVPYLTPVKSYNSIGIANASHRNCMVAAMNSSLFYWFYSAISDCWHFGKWHMGKFPLGWETMHVDLKRELEELHDTLSEDYIKNRKTRFDQRINGELYEYKVSRSKHIINKIDAVLARHYSLSSEELDYIINYDYTFRMGETEFE